MAPPPPPPLSTGALAASVSAMLATAGEVGPSPMSPFDADLARALFVSPSPATGPPLFATPATSRRGRAQAPPSFAHAGQVSPNPRGAPATFWMPPPPVAAAAGGGDGVLPTWQRANSRLSEMFRRPQATKRGAAAAATGAGGRNARAASPPRRGVAAPSVVAPDEEIGALDALHVMRRTDSGGALHNVVKADDDTAAQAAATTTAARTTTTPDGKRVSPLRVAGAAADMLRRPQVVGDADASHQSPAAGGGKLGARPRALLDRAAGGAWEANSPEPTAAVALMSLTPSAQRRAMKA